MRISRERGREILQSSHGKEMGVCYFYFLVVFGILILLTEKQGRTQGNFCEMQNISQEIKL